MGSPAAPLPAWDVLLELPEQRLPKHGPTNDIQHRAAIPRTLKLFDLLGDLSRTPTPMMRRFGTAPIARIASRFSRKRDSLEGPCH